jgi:S1-C subfamily serine protease
MIISSISEYIVPILDVKPDSGKKGIQSATFLGTGFFISDGCLMTCRHVINQAQNVPCAVYKTVGSPNERTFDGLKDIRLHPYADIALAKVGDVASKFYKPLSINLKSEIVLGQDITNYSYVDNSHQAHKVALTPRLFRGYVTC